MRERLFGTDGVRGVAGSELTKELALGLGRAAVGVLGRHGRSRPSVVIGRDTRASGEWLERALADGIRSAGGDAILAGIVPTPAVAFLTVDLGASTGAVISASHNPPEDNGIKFFGPDGRKLPDALEDEIESSLEAEDAAGAEPGRERSAGDGERRYLQHLVDAAGARLDGMTVVVDAANGSAFVDSPAVLRRLGATVHAIFDTPDGGNINVGCGALHPDVVAREVARLAADAGVAHDGDADRAIFADASGRVIDGDQALAACAIDMKERGRLVNDAVVTTPMVNLGFHRAMQREGIEVITARVGDRYVSEEMQRTGAVLGGEQSGHLIFADLATTGDGILTAVILLSIAARKEVSLAELASCMRRFPQVLVNVPVSDKAGFEDSGEVRDAILAAEKALGDQGRVLVRPSGTESLVRVMVEAETQDDAARHADAVAASVRAALG